jgi:hypothetical protein
MSKNNNHDFFADDSLGQLPFDTFTGAKHVSCYETHPVLTMGKGTVYGGSCANPMTLGADIYIGLDSFMTKQKIQYPWNKEISGGPEEVLFKITDGSAPYDVGNFIAMIQWLAKKLEQGKTIHIGCIGGHGRTGMVLAALANVVLGERDAITWVRTNYCKKVVETKTQVDFLHQHFGIKKVEGYKEWEEAKLKSKFKDRNTRKFHQGRKGAKLLTTNDDYIPGTSMLRTRGPRDLPAPEPMISVRHLRTENPHSIWDRLTNAKKLAKV